MLKLEFYHIKYFYQSIIHSKTLSSKKNLCYILFQIYNDIEGSMPTISEFFGILILMFYDDHAPPHFHARYGEHEALIKIEPLGVLKGNLPPRALSLVMEWAAIHSKELIADWKLAEAHQKLKDIPPLE